MAYLTGEKLDPARERAAARTTGEDGAEVEFLGIVRAEEEGLPLDGLEYEAYGPMAEAAVKRLVEEAGRRWPVREVQVRHRTGFVPVGEVSVLIRVRASHRAEAFDACRFLIDRVKEEAPIWKKAVFRAAVNVSP